MREFLKDKSRESGVCAFFTMLLAMCVVGSYYLQYSGDLYWVKLFTYALLLICTVYVFVFACVNKEKDVKIAAGGFIAVFVLALLESIFGVMSRADFRIAAEAITIALKAALVFTLLDSLVLGGALIKKWWYVLLSVVLLLVPAVLKALPMLFTALSNGFLGNNITNITIVFNALVAAFGVAGIVFAAIQIAKKQYTYISWSALLYSLSVLMYGIFGILRIYMNAEQWTKNTAMLFEVAAVLLILAMANLHKPALKKAKKK